MAEKKTARYIAETNVLLELPEIEEPIEPMAICYPQDEYGYERAMRHYNIQMAEYKDYESSLRTIQCALICKRKFIDGETYEEGKDYKVCDNATIMAAFRNLNKYKTVRPMAFPILQPQSEDEDRWWQKVLDIVCLGMGYQDDNAQIIRNLKNHFHITNKQQ